MTVQFQHLAGRSFLLGLRDCYAIVVDFYFDNFGIVLTNFARPQDWASDLESLIRSCHEVDGFRMITDWKPADLRPGDILCMAVGESEPNHMAVYVGDNEVVHHLYGRFSSVDPFRDFFRNTTCFVLRHPDVPDLRPVLPNTDFRSILRDRYAVRPA